MTLKYGRRQKHCRNRNKIKNYNSNNSGVKKVVVVLNGVILGEESWLIVISIKSNINCTRDSNFETTVLKRIYGSTVFSQIYTRTTVFQSVDCIVDWILQVIQMTQRCTRRVVTHHVLSKLVQSRRTEIIFQTFNDHHWSWFTISF